MLHPCAKKACYGLVSHRSCRHHKPQTARQSQVLPPRGEQNEGRSRQLHGSFAGSAACESRLPGCAGIVHARAPLAASRPARQTGPPPSLVVVAYLHTVTSSCAGPAAASCAGPRDSDAASPRSPREACTSACRVCRKVAALCSDPVVHSLRACRCPHSTALRPGAASTPCLNTSLLILLMLPPLPSSLLLDPGAPTCVQHSSVRHGQWTAIVLAWRS